MPIDNYCLGHVTKPLQRCSSCEYGTTIQEVHYKVCVAYTPCEINIVGKREDETNQTKKV